MYRGCSQGSSVGIKTRLDDREIVVRFSVGARNCSVLRTVTYSATHSVHNGCVFLWVNEPVELTAHIYRVSGLRISGALLPLPHILSWPG
jgi:hypothetical protein